MKTVNNTNKESLHEQNPRGFMATHSTNEDKGLTIYYDGMPGGQERTIDFAQTLVKDGYDIEWSNNESNLKENQDEKLNTPKEKIQETTQQSRSTTGVTDKGEASRSPNTNPSSKKREIEVEG
jgi:hypothetical protein